MSKRRQPGFPQAPVRPRLIRTARDLAAVGGALETRMPCRITYLTDPALGGMAPAALDATGQVVADHSDTLEPFPVVLFEPVHTLMSHNTQSGLVQELRIEAITAAAFGRLTASPLHAFRPAPGWEVRRLPGGLALRDPAGDVWATSDVVLDPAWVSAAVSYRSVVVLFGPKLGVRTPPGMKETAYTPARRAAEFRQARAEGLVAAATVSWRGEPADETLEWMTFLPGSLGQPFAGVFAPESTFAIHGGADLFGLTRLGDTALCVPPEPLHTLAARVSRTDIDLVDPAAVEPDSQLGGVHYAEGIASAWRKTARRHGVILLLTGPRMPGTPAASRGSEQGNLASLWAGLLPVQFA